MFGNHVLFQMLKSNVVSPLRHEIPKMDLGFVIRDESHPLGQSFTLIKDRSGQLFCELADNDTIRN